MDNRIKLKELKNSIRGKHPVFSNALKKGYHVYIRTNCVS